MSRYFIGIPIPSEAKKKIRVQSWPGLSRYKDEKLVPQQNWHLTLAFIGHLDEDKASELMALLTSYMWGKSFNLSIRNFGGFPSLEEAKILWAGVHKGQSEITDLALELRKQLDNLGIKYDDKPFVPHMTLARIRSSKNISRLKENGKMKQEITFEVNRFHLFDSEKQKNPYQIIETISLE
jgi:2'-5' RNA ligase